MNKLLFGLLLLASCSLHAQHYQDSILQYRQRYKNDFLSDKNSPLTADDTAYLRFYPADSSYLITAKFHRSSGSSSFMMPTHSGKDKEFKEYGTLTFKLHDTLLTLHAYQNIALSKQEQYKDDLFIPFTDLTNYTETFGGGRYIDISIKDISHSKILLDFNKCYNPYCAFKGGYSCPIPPRENALPVAIKAGELLFGKAVKED